MGISSLPDGYVETADANGNPYYYANGVFYRASGGKYIVAAAPQGAIVPMLPDGYQTVAAGDTTYYDYNGVRYLPMMADGQTVYVVQ